MNKRKLLLIFITLAVCLGLVVIIQNRSARNEEIVFGGANGGFLQVRDQFPDPAVTPEPIDDGAVWPALTLEILQENRQYAIVNDNKNNLLSSAFQPECGTIGGTRMLFDVNALPYLEEMLQDLRDHGFTPYVAGAYRSYTFQEKLFNGKASQIAAGMKPPVTDFMDPRYQEAADQAKQPEVRLAKGYQRPAAAEQPDGKRIQRTAVGRDDVQYYALAGGHAALRQGLPMQRPSS